TDLHVLLQRLRVLAERVRQRTGGVRIVRTGGGRAADTEETQVDAGAAAAADRRRTERGAGLGGVQHIEVAHAVGHARRVVRLLGGGLVAVAEVGLAVEAETG